MTERRGSRRELTLVACALLLPIPLLAASGLGIPLPSAVERGLASLLPLAGDQEASVPARESGTTVSTGGSTGGQPATEGRAAVSGEGALPPGTPFPRVEGQDGSSGTKSGSGGGTGSGGPGGEADPPTGGDTPPDDGPGPDADEPGAGQPGAVGPSDAPTLSVAVDGPGASAEASVNEDGVSVDAALGDGADVGVNEDLLPDVGGTLPGSGLGVP